MRYVKYCMDMWCSYSIMVEIEGLGSLSFIRDHILGVWMAPSILTVTVIKCLTCQHSVCSLTSNALYFCSLCAMESLDSLS